MKKYEIHRQFKIGPFTYNKKLAEFNNKYVAEHVLISKTLTAKRKGKKALYLLIECSTGKVLLRKHTRKTLDKS